MAYLLTAQDLKADALSLAGEPSTGSEYDDDVYSWLTVVQRALISGGQFGPTLLEPMDWDWARAYPRGTLQLVQPYNRDLTRNAIFVTGSDTATILTTTPIDLTGWRVARSDVAARHLIVSQSQTSAAITIHWQSPWTGPTDTADDWWAYPDTYQLPTDFVRGCSPLFATGIDLLVGPVMLDVVDPMTLERRYPHGSARGGFPELAARVSQDRLRFSHYLDTPSEPQPALLEFEYIRRPPVLAEGTIPVIPEEHRRVLSYGCAYLILDDKSDSTADGMWKMFQTQVKAMRDEAIRGHYRMSGRWGVIQPPRMSGYPLRRTESGLPVFTW